MGNYFCTKLKESNRKQMTFFASKKVAQDFMKKVGDREMSATFRRFMRAVNNGVIDPRKLRDFDPKP